MEKEWYIVEVKDDWDSESIKYELMEKENIAFRFDGKENPRFWKVTSVQEMEFEASIKEKKD